MSNSKSTDLIEHITNEIWRMFDILRGSIPTDDLQVILFLLSAYKDRLLKDARHSEYYGDINHDVLDSISNDSRYRKLLDIYGPIIKLIPSDKLEYVLDYLENINSSDLEENFSEIFDNLLYRLSDAQGKYSGEFIQPLELTRFIMNLANLPDNATVYNPFAGLASFGTFLNHSQRYYAQELNQRTWALGMLRLMAFNNINFDDYDLDDSIEHWNNFGKFDLIVSNPPFGLKLPHTYYGSMGITVESFLIERSLESLPKNGQLICILPLGFLHRGGREKKFREELIERGLIDTIISLPSGLFKHTGIPTCLVVFKKSYHHYDKIRFVNATDFFISHKSRNKILDDRLLNNVISEDLENKFVKFISTEKIRLSGYNLNVQRYLANEYPGINLSEIGEINKGKRVSKGEYGKLIRVRDLKDDRIDHLLNWELVEDAVLPIPARKIEESCILIAIKWKTLKPTYFEYRGIPIYISSGIVTLKIDETLVDTNYLINELHSENTLSQIESFRISGTIPSIHTVDLFNIKIELPSIEEQRGKVKGLKELSKRIGALQKERNALAHGKSIAQFDEFASLKHSLGAPRQNILSNAKSLERFFENNNSEAFLEVNNRYQKRYDISLLEVFQQIKEDINHISVMLEKGEAGLILNNYPNEILPLKTINKIVNSYKENGYNFNITKYLLYDEDLDKIGVECNMVLFKILLENILSNATKYGFSEKTIVNEVVIELKVIENFLEIIIKNNGAPFPKNFDKAKFTAKFSTADIDKGTGLGGYDINRIANHFGNPDWDLILDNDGLYTVMFKFNFQLVQIENE